MTFVGSRPIQKESEDPTNGNQYDCDQYREETNVLAICKWWPGTESNRRRRPFQGRALPTELPGQMAGKDRVV